MFSFLKALSSTAKWNEEPAQQELATLILNAAIKQAETGITSLNLYDVFKLRNSNNWSQKETANRCVHAVSMIRNISAPAVYKAAVKEGEFAYRGLTN